MIVVDSSALIAILFDAAERSSFFDVLVEVEKCLSAVNAHECLTVLRSRRGLEAVETFWTLVADLDIEIVDFDLAQVRAAFDAFDRYGKGIHAGARLNLCDCAAYALAKTRDVPLLFKGDDFAHTDTVPAV